MDEIFVCFFESKASRLSPGMRERGNDPSKRLSRLCLLCLVPSGGSFFILYPPRNKLGLAFAGVFTSYKCAAVLNLYPQLPKYTLVSHGEHGGLVLFGIISRRQVGGDRNDDYLFCCDRPTFLSRRVMGRAKVRRAVYLRTRKSIRAAVQLPFRRVPGLYFLGVCSIPRAAKRDNK